MFSKLSKIATEIENSLLQEFKTHEEEGDLSALETVSAEEKLDRTLNLLVQAAEGFESLGLDDEADKTNALIEDLAGISTIIDDHSIVRAREELDLWLKEAAKKKSPKSNKSKSKSSKKTKKTVKKVNKVDLADSIKDLSPEEAVSNLKEYGWVFPLNEETKCMPCMMADDAEMNCGDEMSNPMKKNEDYGGNWLDNNKADNMNVDDYNWLDE